MGLHCGIDFGTSNSIIYLVDEKNRPVYNHMIPSYLFFAEGYGKTTENKFVGDDAINMYLASGMKGRFIQSIKSSLSDPSLQFTQIYNKRIKIEILVSILIKHLKEKAEKATGTTIERAVIGRPVNFSANHSFNSLAESRIRTAAQSIGLKNIEFQLEPNAAAYFYGHKKKKEETVLICDFGGGTSDFTLLKMNFATNGETPSDSILGVNGIKIGGDDFDYQIMFTKIIKHFGHNSMYESWGKLLPVPIHIFTSICDWRLISFLNNRKFLEELKYIHNGSTNKPAIKNLMTLITKQLGFALAREVKQAKHQFSTTDESKIHFHRDNIAIEETLSLEAFNGLIEPKLLEIEETIDDLLKMTALKEGDVDTVFLTGGTSATLRLQSFLKNKFREANMVCDENKFISVARGLSMMALNQQLPHD